MFYISITEVPERTDPPKSSKMDPAYPSSLTQERVCPFPEKNIFSVFYTNHTHEKF